MLIIYWGLACTIFVIFEENRILLINLENTRRKRIVPKRFFRICVSFSVKCTFRGIQQFGENCESVQTFKQEIELISGKSWFVTPKMCALKWKLSTITFQLFSMCYYWRDFIFSFFSKFILDRETCGSCEGRKVKHAERIIILPRRRLSWWTGPSV